MSAQRVAAALAGVVLLACCQSSSTESSPIATSALEPPPSATLAPSGGPTATASPSTGPPAPVDVDVGIVQVLVDELRVRSAPTANAEAVAGLSTGQVVRVTGASEKADGIVWVEIVQQPAGRTGWVAATDAEGRPWLAMVRDGPIGVTAGEDAELVDPGTGQRTPLTSGMNVADLAFAPDGERVGLIAPVDGSRVVSIDAVTAPEPTPEPTGPVFGPPAMVYPAFAPNGEAVAFLQGQNFLGLSLIWLGEGESPTFPFPSTLHPLSWSPDSRRIVGAEWVNVQSGGPENWEIVVAEQGQPQAIRLTNREGIDVRPAWSPDGSTIAFLQDSGHGSVALALMNADGSGMRTLLTFDGSPISAAQPSWSPDGSRVAIAQQLEGFPAAIHLVDASTSEHLSIAATAERCDDLTWSPTGTRIAFVCGPIDGSAPAAYVATVGQLGVEDLGPAWHVDWARTLEPIRVD